MQSSPVKVLVVDDTPAKLYAKVRVLRAAGFEVVEAVTGTAALRLAAQMDVVVLDVLLPDISGLEVCQLLRDQPATANIPIIQVSSVYVREEDIRNGAEAGADVYLLEPVPTEVLVRVIESAIGARESRLRAPQQVGQLVGITYTSSAVTEPTTEEIQELLAKSRTRNLHEGITGILLYGSGTFHQYLEGPEAGVNRVYESIQRSPLHHHIFELSREPITAREFEGWAMGYRSTAAVTDSFQDSRLDELLADGSPKLPPGRLLLNAFWSSSAAARFRAAGGLPRPGRRSGDAR